MTVSRLVWKVSKGLVVCCASNSLGSADTKGFEAVSCAITGESAGQVELRESVLRAIGTSKCLIFEPLPDSVANTPQVTERLRDGQFMSLLTDLLNADGNGEDRLMKAFTADELGFKAFATDILNLINTVSEQ